MKEILPCLWGFFSQSLLQDDKFVTKPEGRSPTSHFWIPHVPQYTTFFRAFLQKMPDGLPYEVATAVPVATLLYVTTQYSSHYDTEQETREYAMMRGFIICNTKNY